MHTYIALLRGINVGGKRKILMADLKALMLKLGFSAVRTYIQSGNIIFQSAKTNKLAVAQIIEQAIMDEFGFDVPCIVLVADELEQLINRNPFNDEDEVKKEQLHLTFLKSIPNKDNKTRIETYDYSPDQFQIEEDKVFIYCEGKYHLTKLGNTFFEKQLGVSASTRTWKTVLKLNELYKAY